MCADCLETIEARRAEHRAELEAAGRHVLLRVLSHNGPEYYPPRPCAGCGRPVFETRWYGRGDRQRPQPRRAACCRPCEQRGRYQAKTAHTRQKTCATCAICLPDWTPYRRGHWSGAGSPRRDQRYCSPACRQRAYRQRRAS